MTQHERNSRPAPASDKQVAQVFNTIESAMRAPLTNGGSLKIPATYSQKALHFVQAFQPDSAAYNIPFDYRFRGSIDTQALEFALQTMVQRHDILRTSFQLVDNQLYQCIAADVELQHEVIDATQWTEQNIEQHCLRWAREPFDLTQAPLMRSRLLRIESGFAWFLCFHHIAFDHLSIGLFAKELNAAYQRAQINPEAVSQQPLPLSVADYAIWQQEHQSPEKMRDKLAYWQEAVEDPGIVLDLPTDYARPAIIKGDGAEIWFSFDSATAELNRQTAQKYQVSRYLLTMTQCAILLHRYSRQDQFLLGTPFANRSDQPELQNVFGCFINTLPLPFDFRDKPSLETLLTRTQQHFLKIFERQDTPFELIIEQLRPPRDTSYHPLFQVAFMYQDPPMAMTLGDLVGENQKLHNHSSKFDLTFWMWDEPPVAGQAGLSGSLEYSTALFGETSMLSMLDVFERIVKTSCEQPQVPVAQLPLVDEHDPDAIALRGPQLTIATDHMLTGLHGAVARQAQQTPEAIAVVSDNGKLTYAVLWQQATILADALQQAGVKQGDYVGVSLNRSTSLLVACLAVLQAGCAYVPLDPKYPADRLAYMISHSKMPAILTETAVKDSLPLALLAKADTSDNHQAENRQQALPVLLVLDQLLAPTSAQADEKGAAANHPLTPPKTIDPEQPAYVIYTSGSTGLPKGVAVPHRSVVNFLCSMQERPGFTAKDQLMAVTTLSFDISVLELFLPLVCGGTVDVVPTSVIKDAVQLHNRLVAFKPTIMQATPATWRMLIQAGWEGHEKPKILVGGEALPEDLVAELVQRADSVWNMYGPTETTIWSTCAPITDPAAPIVIGAPIHNTQCYVLDADHKPLPSGVPGELFIGGDGVALGYLHQPELTSERFVPALIGDGLMYRTGDLVTRLNTGDLKYHNRLDNQVKIRGFRIELGEIEQVLLQQSEVQAGAVVVQGEGLDKRLVAFYVQAAQANISMMLLRRALMDRLPRHMVPELFVCLEKLPLTPSGKIDRRALAAHRVRRAGEISEAQIPSTASEKYYAEIWKKLLKRDQVSIHDNFFDIGGHSLSSLGIVSAAKNDHGISIPANAMVFNTLGQLAAIYAIPEAVKKPDDIDAVTHGAAAGVNGSQHQSDDAQGKEGKSWWNKLLGR